MSPSRSIALLAVVLALLGAIVAHFIYWDRPELISALSTLPDQVRGPWLFPVHAAMGLLALAAMWFAAVGVGSLVLHRGGAAPSFPSFWQQYVLSLLVGWLALGLAALVFGLVGLANRAGLGVLLIVAAALGIRGWGYLLTTLRRADRPAGRADFEIPGWILALVLLLYAGALPYALTPSIQSDELRYHLAAPEAYLQEGRIQYLPYQAFSNFPFLTEMLFMIAMGIQGVEAAKTIHVAFLETSSILVALLAFMLIRLSLGRHCRAVPARAIAATAGAAFAAIPSQTILAGWAFVDIATAAYVLAAAYIGVLVFGRRNPPPAWLLGAMAAGAIGTKYLIVPLMLGVAALLFVMMSRDFRKRGLTYGPAQRYISRACLVAAMLASPWFVKNLLWTGNPVYPLAYGIFGGGEWSDTNAKFYAEKAAEKGFRLEYLYPGTSFDDSYYQMESMIPAALHRAVEFLISPITTSLAGERFENHFAGPLPLMAMALAAAGLVSSLFSRRFSLKAAQPPSAVIPGFAPLLWILALIMTTWTYWFLTYQSIRMLLPSFGLIFALGGWGGAVVLQPLGQGDRQRTGSTALAAIVLVAMLYSWMWTADTIVGRFLPHPLPVAFGFQQREDYLRQALPYYEPAQWLAARVKPDERALLIGEHRTLYFPNEVVASDWFDTPQPLPFIRMTKDNEELFEKLRAENIRFILLNGDELRKYIGAYFRPRFTPEEYARFEAFLADPRLKLIHKDQTVDIMIYEIFSPEPGGSF